MVGVWQRCYGMSCLSILAHERARVNLHNARPWMHARGLAARVPHPFTRMDRSRHAAREKAWGARGLRADS